MKKLKVTPIKNGTVIDHIPSGMGMDVLRILGAPAQDATVSILINAPSKHDGRKDVVKVENKELKTKELNKIALISPDATINIIRDYKVVKKSKVTLPKRLKGIARCGNPNCITNQPEPVEPEFGVVSRSPMKIKCMYCERELTEIHKHLI